MRSRPLGEGGWLRGSDARIRRLSISTSPRPISIAPIVVGNATAIMTNPRSKSASSGGGLSEVQIGDVPTAGSISGVRGTIR